VHYPVETRKILTAGKYLAEVLASTGRPCSTDHLPWCSAWWNGCWHAAWYHNGADERTASMQQWRHTERDITW